MTQENSLRSEANEEQKRPDFKDYWYQRIWSQPGFLSKGPVLSGRSRAMKLLHFEFILSNQLGFFYNFLV